MFLQIFRSWWIQIRNAYQYLNLIISYCQFSNLPAFDRLKPFYSSPCNFDKAIRDNGLRRKQLISSLLYVMFNNFIAERWIQKALWKSLIQQCMVWDSVMLRMLSKHFLWSLLSQLMSRFVSIIPLCVFTLKFGLHVILKSDLCVLHNCNSN